MTEICVLLVCREANPFGPILEGISSSPLYRIEKAASLDLAFESLERDECSLVVVYLADGINLDRVEELAWECSTSPAPVPMVAISDRYDEKQALALFRAGVVDYLSLSDHGEKGSLILEGLVAQEPGRLAERSRGEIEGERVLAVTGARRGRSS